MENTPQEQEKTTEFPLPIQIGAEAAQILSTATAAIRAILDRRAALDAAGQYDTKLAVILGEAHDNPAHRVSQMLILDGLQDWHRTQTATHPRTHPLILCHELEHSALTQAFGHIAKQPATGNIRARLDQNDPQGKIAIKAYLGFFALLQGDYSKAALLRAAQKNNVLNFMTDSEKNSQALETADPDTRAAIIACDLDPAAPPSPTSEDGVRVRNYQMAHTALARAEQHGARIVLQQCGNAHVVGLEDSNDKTQIYQTAHSLSAAFQNAGASILAMPQTGTTLGTMGITTDHGLDGQDYLALDGLPNHATAYNPFTNQPMTDQGEDDGSSVLFKCREEEAVYLNALLGETGLGDATLGLGDYYQKRLDDFAELQHYCAQTIMAVTAMTAVREGRLQYQPPQNLHQNLRRKLPVAACG